MADFKHSFFDFSRGEISEKNLVLSTSNEEKKGVSFLQNSYTTKNKGMKRRAGTIKGPSPRFIVSSTYDNVRAIPFFIGDDLSFLAMVYVSTFDENDEAELGDDYGDGGFNIQGSFYNLTFDFYKIEGEGVSGDTETYLNTYTLPLDPSQDFTPLFTDLLLPESSSLAWTDLYGWKMTSFQNLFLFCHETGSVEPFYFSYNADANLFFPQPAKLGLQTTNPGFYPDAYLSAVLGLPFEQPNLNSDLSIGIQRIGSDANQFTIRAQYWNPVSSAFSAWSSVVTVSNKIHPLAGVKTYIRLNIGAGTYILRYINSPSGRTKDLSFGGDILDPDYSDTHTFSLVLDDRTTPLFTVALASPDFLSTSDFSVEAFTVRQGFPDNLIFQDQRLVFSRKGRFFNSATGNAFFFNQYRFANELMDFVALQVTAPPATLGYTQRPLLLKYGGTKIQSDPFDFIPSSEFLTTRNWLSKSEVMEVGNFGGVNNISGTEDSIYAFDSIRVAFGTSEKSRSTLSVKTKEASLFLGADRKTVYAYRYDGSARKYLADDLNLANDEIMEHNFSDDSGFNLDNLAVKEMSYDDDKDIVYFYLQPTNSVVALRYSREDGIQSWTRVQLGNFEDEFVDIRSTCFIKTNTSQGFQYFVTKRGGTYYLEKIAKEYPYVEMNVRLVVDDYSESDLPVLLDFSERQISGVATDTWTLGAFYANKTVDVFADGFWIKDVLVDNAGTLVLDRDVYFIIAGFRYKSTHQTLSIEPNTGGLNGGNLDAKKHINRHHIRLYRSYGGYIGHTDGSYLEKIPYDADNMVVGVSLKLFTGFKDISPDQESSKDVRGYIETEAPYPFEIIAWNIKGEVNDG